MGRRRAEKNARRQRRRQRGRADRTAAPLARPSRVLPNGLTVEEHLAELRQFIDALARGDGHVGREHPLELDRDAEDRVPDVEAVLALGTDPLPGEERSLPQVDPPSGRLVEEVLDLAEPVAVAIGGVELRTSLRRLTAMAAVLDPGLLLDLSPRRAAAAAVWAVGEINGCFMLLRHHAASLLGTLGEDACYVDDGLLMLRALGWEDEVDAWYTLLHPGLTTSTTRAELFRDELEELEHEDEWDLVWDDDGEGQDGGADDDRPDDHACTCARSG